jgi:hypothetical protein
VGRREANIEFWWRYLIERTHLKGLRVDGEIILKLILMKFIGKLWTKFVLAQICKKEQNSIKSNEVCISYNGEGIWLAELL